MQITLNNAWTFDLFINGCLYTTRDTREQCMEEYREYKRNLRYGR